MPNVTQLPGQQQQGQQDPMAQSRPTPMRSPMPQTGMSMLSGAIGQGPPPPPGGQAGGPIQGPPKMGPGSTNLSDLANYLGRAYGIQIGGQGLVDEQGTFLQTPKNVDEAIKFNMIGQRIADEQTRSYENKAVAALQAETGLLRNRQAGSLARVQAGTYRQLAQTYSSTEIKAQDFNTYIQEAWRKEQFAFAEREIKRARKEKRYAAIGGIIGGVVGAAFGGNFAAGAAAGSSIGAGASTF